MNGWIGLAVAVVPAAVTGLLALIPRKTGRVDAAAASMSLSSSALQMAQDATEQLAETRRQLEIAHEQIMKLQADIQQLQQIVGLYRGLLQQHDIELPGE